MALTLYRILTAEKESPLNYYDALSTESSVLLTLLGCLLAVFLSYRVFSKLLHLVVKVDYWAYTDMLVSAVCIYFLLLWETCAATGRKLCGPTVFSRTRKSFSTCIFLRGG